MKPIYCILLMGLFRSAGIHVGAQSLWVHAEGTVTRTDLSAVQKITFSEGLMVVSYQNHSSEGFQLSGIQKIVFDTGSTGTGENLTLSPVIVNLFPNPAVHEIRLEGASEGPYHMRHIDGKIIRSGHYILGQPVDVNGLQPGFYLFTIQGVTLKWLKQ